MQKKRYEHFRQGKKRTVGQIWQSVRNMGKRITFDIIPIKNGEKEKDIYFDVTDFYYGAEVSYTGVASDYAERKITELYNESNT